MKARVWLMGSLALLSALGCGDKQPKQEAEAPAPAVDAAPQAAAPTAPPPQRSDVPSPLAPQRAQVEMGYEIDERGSIPAALASREFAAASPFVLAVRNPDGASSAAVTVRWLGERDTVLGERTLRFEPGREFLDFTGPDTRTWRSGPYKAEVRVGDGSPTVLDFSIVRAGESAS